MSETTVFDCDVCGSGDAAEITCLRAYSGGRPIHVCRNCGFVYVRERRSFSEIADAWSYEEYGAEKSYSAYRPAVRARQTFVAATIDAEIGLVGKRVCDIGAGEGLFGTMLREAGADVFSIEPSPALCADMTVKGLENFVGTIETYLDSPTCESGMFDIATIIWTLENCHDCRLMLEGAHRLLKPGGHLVVATGSRILVPFKKPLQYYIANANSDIHNFRFSAATLERLFAACGFEKTFVNRYIDSDVLCMIGRHAEGAIASTPPADDWKQVIDFFNRWDADTQANYTA